MVLFCRQLTGPADWVFVVLGPLLCAEPRGGCLGPYCNMVEYMVLVGLKPILGPAGLLQCFDAVDWIIWPVKIVTKITYNVSSGTLSLYSLTHCSISVVFRFNIEIKMHLSLHGCLRIVGFNW